MNIGTIVTPNIKGQIVIPKKIRDDLNISAGQLLNVIVSNGGIHMYPVNEVVTEEEKSNKREVFLEILKSTQGAWAGDDWPETEKRRRKIELKASRERKKAW
ncbi:AbrB/MazE/SpoVT family DNA-binding domain-containing protein [Candidatus Daviesbacteria bacterium]|nr:AbrB/MazE/SpoVT family DNA-binding domain-containing protein [Candidatus Daviesbacteria bacterium]